MKIAVDLFIGSCSTNMRHCVGVGEIVSPPSTIHEIKFRTYGLAHTTTYALRM